MLKSKIYLKKPIFNSKKPKIYFKKRPIYETDYLSDSTEREIKDQALNFLRKEASESKIESD